MGEWGRDAPAMRLDERLDSRLRGSDVVACLLVYHARPSPSLS